MFRWWMNRAARPTCPFDTGRARPATQAGWTCHGQRRQTSARSDRARHGTRASGRHPIGAATFRSRNARAHQRPVCTGIFVTAHGIRICVALPTPDPQCRTKSGNGKGVAHCIGAPNLEYKVLVTLGFTQSARDRHRFGRQSASRTTFEFACRTVDEIQSPNSIDTDLAA